MVMGTCSLQTLLHLPQRVQAEEGVEQAVHPDYPRPRPRHPHRALPGTRVLSHVT